MSQLIFIIVFPRYLTEAYAIGAGFPLREDHARFLREEDTVPGVTRAMYKNGCIERGQGTAEVSRR